MNIMAVAQTKAEASEAPQQHVDWEQVVIDMSLREGCRACGRVASLDCGV